MPDQLIQLSGFKGLKKIGFLKDATQAVENRGGIGHFYSKLTGQLNSLFKSISPNITASKR
jgi:hypothetical protein